MPFPDYFITTIRNTFKEDGEKFLAVLPALIEDASQRWGLSDCVMHQDKMLPWG
jgi:hypothetical protein